MNIQRIIELARRIERADAERAAAVAELAALTGNAPAEPQPEPVEALQPVRNGRGTPKGYVFSQEARQNMSRGQKRRFADPQQRKLLGLQVSQAKRAKRLAKANGAQTEVQP